MLNSIMDKIKTVNYKTTNDNNVIDYSDILQNIINTILYK